MGCDWNEAKCVANLAKHGVDFSLVEGFDWSIAWVLADTRFDCGEARLSAIGPIGRRVHVLVFIIERRTVRMISLRRANRKEVDRHEATL